MQNDQQNDMVSDWIRLAATDACTALFSAYGVCIDQTPERPLASNELLYCGVIGFVGSGIRGTCLLAATQTPLEQSRPVDGSLRDWTGELTNQLAGRLKVKLLGRGTRIAITTPVVLRGEHLAPLPRKALKPISFQASPGVILLWIETETAEDFVLQPETEQAPATSEGDLVLF